MNSQQGPSYISHHTLTVNTLTGNSNMAAQTGSTYVSDSVEIPKILYPHQLFRPDLELFKLFDQTRSHKFRGATFWKAFFWLLQKVKSEREASIFVSNRASYLQTRHRELLLFSERMPHEINLRRQLLGWTALDRNLIHYRWINCHWQGKLIIDLPSDTILIASIRLHLFSERASSSVINHVARCPLNRCLL